MCHARQFFSLESILNIYKSTIHPCLEYCCHTWSGAPAIYLEILDKIQRISNIIGLFLVSRLQSLSHPQNVTSYAFSINTLMVIVRMNSLLWYLDFVNLSTILDWQQGLINFQLNWLEVNPSSMPTQ